ncbi:hypothetical protein A676_03575 [Salmonella enterica subsp. enterica serovar Enteritidis str. 2010K-0262]|uniref:Uncharacterized protein n=3 Tax=Salmonella enterica I TaxID=59201 RepID=M7RX22_SALDU|nr:hypothetical protein SPAB_05665 [Salmonella enterica subsp. enterica serovar Paratyphi B str. SPB7]ALP99731.1 hypothetical protein FORC20_3954 [Salmonella enterica subsp. enterica serovar Typhimurium]EGE36735.1 hypothetical protein SG9_4421 [Salmonella enterica subsp. enterica serovar Gallinarum str. SG9]EMR50346.1 hypothetical protein A670_04460 [Salmonella enterica subsp. enterica serovar Dublin str. UC16]EPI64301.1 hypothetical protein A671_04758 [Salmonella enterica subsp. enterica serov
MSKCDTDDMQFKNQSSYCTPYYCTEQLITKKTDGRTKNSDV